MRSLTVVALFCVVVITGCDCKSQKLKQCTPEICDDIDNDCDGEIDEDLPVLKCGVGECAREVYSCNNGVQVSCQPGDPAAEACNGLDDDCDGDADEGLGESVTCGVGACTKTVIACASGTAADCVPGAPTDEVCNAIDDDCDGDVDEGLDTPVVCGVGACQVTVSACFEGAAQQCTAGEPTTEICNGVDDDCNGAIDEGLDVTLSCGTGQCARTVSACTNGTPATCEPGTPASEICNGLDDNCDGVADEGLNNIVSCGIGACARYISSCSNGVPGNCLPGAPTTEVCNDLDDDCDGRIDEDYVCGVPTVLCPPTVYATFGEPVSVSANVGGSYDFAGWSISSRPAPQSLADGGTQSSTCDNSPHLGASTTFTPDLRGNYTLTFSAASAESGFTSCNTLVSMDTCDTPPPPPASTACSTSWDGRPIIELASAVLPNEHYELNIAGESTLRATATPYQTYLRPASRISAGGPTPGVDTTLELRRCIDGGPRCCSSPTIIHTNIVEACTTPVSPTSSNLIISEYVIDGEGACPGASCEAGEAIELTNLSNCPLSLDGFHFAYRNSAGTAWRWMNFGPSEIVPPRGVYVAMRGDPATLSVCGASLAATTQSPNLFGLKISTLSMMGSNLDTGWFVNSGGTASILQVASGTIPDTATSLSFTSYVTQVSPYVAYAQCHGTGFNAVNSCGDITSASRVDLSPNQLGRLWHPCDNLTSPMPACVRD